jgi:uncharacterized protein (TIGR02594 family)
MTNTLTIIADTLNVRDGAGKDHPVVAQLPKGTRVQRLDAADGWFRIQTSNGVVGWISGKYAAEESAPPADATASAASGVSTDSAGSTASDASTASTTPAASAEPAPAAPRLRVTAATLNLRAGPGKDEALVRELPNGTVLEQLEAAGGWTRVRVPGGAEGWVSSKYVEAHDGDASATPAQRAPAATRLRVTATTLNLRAGPGKDQPLVKQLPNGMVVDPLEVAGEWTRVRSPGGFEGWVSSKYVQTHDGTDPHAATGDDPAWYGIAWAERGQRETDGPGDNVRILEYQKACTYNAHDEDVPWCSSFANWVMQQAGIKGSGEASARSWLNWGQKLETPRRGCIVVLKRPGSPTNGHVAFYVGEENGRLKLLGGNQENQVKISFYDKGRLLGYRWPKGVS